MRRRDSRNYSGKTNDPMRNTRSRHEFPVCVSLIQEAELVAHSEGGSDCASGPGGARSPIRGRRRDRPDCKSDVLAAAVGAEPVVSSARV
ncbi:hypothetical protein EYF80_043213 [Liparis tanakae]|uniref:Uncharacterized protein n=1 Tax=Liparis tanakae TaxID=230148 RepID=A0A4Z2G162_9TELE|nr:hypothetical protein EYF80_043213 [Liparis tanakae]